MIPKTTLDNTTRNYLSAVHLYTDSNGNSVFEYGKIPCQDPIKGDYFFAQVLIEAYQKKVHPAPRKQYVVTLKGKLRFTVSDGSAFIIEPGKILVAEDVEGEGHSWSIIDGEEWVRLYIPIPENTISAFVPDQVSQAKSNSI